MRPSSINKKDDQINSRDSLNTEKQRLEHQIRKQSFDLESGGYQKANATGWKEGLIKNRYRNRIISYDIMNNGSLIASHQLGGNIRNNGPYTILVQLPIGSYEVIIKEYKVKGTKEVARQKLEVTNKANFFDNGTPYFFIITN